MKKILLEFFKPWGQLTAEKKRSAFLTCIIFFFLLFSYPILRSSIDSLFLHEFGAQRSPLVWLLSITCLILVVGIYNKWQKKIGIIKLFTYTSLFSIFIFGVLSFFAKRDFNLCYYGLYIWKECYIVLLIHSLLAYFNSFLSANAAKLLYGPLGTLGSLGGLLGGLLTSRIANQFETGNVVLIGASTLIVPLFIIPFVRASEVDKEETAQISKEKALTAIRGVRKYVFGICLIVLLGQFIVNIVNFEFFVLVSSLLKGTQDKTAFFGKVYSSVNAVTFFCQLLLTPFIFKIFSLKNIHIALWFVFAASAVTGSFFGVGSLFLLGGSFIIIKGVDYSLFSVAKELLYYPLNFSQKYGAKYLTDMIVYRLGKGLISVFLLYVQQITVLNYLLICFIGLWIGSLWWLFNEQKKINFTPASDL